jgi:hypothetical protein
VVGYGFLNLALGLGSFVQGDPWGGVTVLGSYGAAAGLILWEMSMSYDDALSGIPGLVGIGAFSFAVVYGFIRPAIYARSRAAAGIIDGINIGPAPGQRPGAVQLSYTVKF